jgi:putative PIG3 family NAD(P)H quinone oxidoreductase
MRAYVLERYGDPDVLTLRDVPPPPLPLDGVRVAVVATALNRADLLQRRGRYPGPPMPYEIPGLEFAGRVVEVGPEAAGVQPGDRVMGLVAGGAYADEVVTTADLCLPVPDRLSWEEAAAVPEAFLTAWDALDQLDVGLGDWILVHAAASGVGTALVQLARERGARVIGTAGGPEKCARVKTLGALAVVDRLAVSSFVDPVRSATGGQGVNAIADLVGAPYAADNLAVLAPQGRWLVIGTVGGQEATLPLGQLLGKRLTLRGTQLRGRARWEKAALMAAFRRRALPLLQDGTVAPVIDRVYPFEAMAEAHRWMEANRNIGKIVVRVRPGDP